MMVVIARGMLPLLTHSEQCIGIAHQAIQEASKWVRGEKIDLETFVELAEGEDELSMAECMLSSASDCEAAWATFAISITYVIHYAFAEEGIHTVTAAVDECTDALLNDQMGEVARLLPERTTGLTELFLKALAEPSSDSAVEMVLSGMENLTE